jgi:peptidoglycan/LPS O-acetylase OafA/YrhL
MNVMIREKDQSTDLPGAVSSERSASPRFDFLDGLRGIAALYVVLYHILSQYSPDLPLARHLSPAVYYGTWWMRYGHWAVVVFIVLSGYCLMMPVAQSRTGTLRHGVIGYLKRRAWRILPPYYVVLAISFVPLVLGRWLPGSAAISASSWQFNFSPIAIGSHLFLIHNWRPDTNMLYNSPLWSVSTEWQIYFLFPLLLIARRRAGTVVALLLAIVVGLLPHYLMPLYNLDWACPWFIGLFALGMVGAEINLTSSQRAAHWRDRVPWGSLAAILFAAAVTLATVHPQKSDPWILDFALGLSSVCLIVYCASRKLSHTAHETVVVRVLSSRPALAVGQISYSLYLSHNLVVTNYARILQRLHASFLSSPVPFFAICIPVSLGFAYLLYALVERRCLVTRQSVSS